MVGRFTTKRWYPDWVACFQSRSCFLAGSESVDCRVAVESRVLRNQCSGMAGVLQEGCILADSESLLAGQNRLLAELKSFSLVVSTLRFYQKR